MNIRAFRKDDCDAVVALWDQCGLIVPWNDARRDIERKLKIQRELFLVGVTNDTIVATIMGGYEGHRGWLNYLAVSPGYRNCGYGSAMVKAVEEKIALLGCPKINLQVRTTNTEVITFYRSLGYKVDDVIGLGKRLKNDNSL
jgi:ribosomal protein S18 acetylase RimI-like enzyme